MPLLVRPLSSLTNKLECTLEGASSLLEAVAEDSLPVIFQSIEKLEIGGFELLLGKEC